MDNINHKNDSGTERVFDTQAVKYFVIIATVAGIIFSISSRMEKIDSNIALIQQSIDNINKNHEAHIQDLTQNIKDQNIAIVANQQAIIELQKQVLLLQQRANNAK